MILFCLLCVSLVLGGLAYRRELGVILNDLRRHLFGVRVRVRAPQRGGQPARTAPSPLQLGSVPPPRVTTRPRG